MNESTLSGKWNEIKGELRRMWGDLTDDELEKAKGNTQSIQGLIQQKYGQTKDDWKTKLDGLFARYGVNDKAEDVKSDLRDSKSETH